MRRGREGRGRGLPAAAALPDGVVVRVVERQAVPLVRGQGPPLVALRLLGSATRPPAKDTYLGGGEAGEWGLGCKNHALRVVGAELPKTICVSVGPDRHDRGSDKSLPSDPATLGGMGLAPRDNRWLG